MSVAPEVLSGPLHPAGRPSRLALWVLRLMGWSLDVPGLPTKQGVVLVYPHTSNWDFVIGMLAKWGMGIQIRFWGKDSLFRVPLLGRWVRYLGGVAVDRSNSNNIVAETVRQLRAAQQQGEPYWLAAAPEGTRSHATGWRTGAYQVALQAGVPVGLAYMDFERRTVSLSRFLRLTGNIEADFAAFHAYLSHRVGKRPELAAPVRPRT